MFRRRRTALVAGSAHLDVIGDTSDTETIDKKGHVSFSVGGTAFNIATNLALHRRRVFLFTYLASDWILTRLIYRRIRLNRIRTRHVYRQEELDGAKLAPSAFLAHRDVRTKSLLSAVSSTSVGDSQFHNHPRERARLEKAVRRADVIAVDCNLRRETVKKVLELAKAQGKPVVVAGVSQSKMADYCGLELSAEQRPDVVVATREEAAYCLERHDTELAQAVRCDLADAEATRICELTRATCLVVTDPDHYTVLSTGGRCRRYDAPRIPSGEIASSTGAGDALTAAIVDAMLKALERRSAFDLCDPQNPQNLGFDLNEYMERVLRVPGATPDSSLELSIDESLKGVSWPRQLFLRTRRLAAESVAINVLYLLGVVLIAGLVYLGTLLDLPARGLGLFDPSPPDAVEADPPPASEEPLERQP